MRISKEDLAARFEQLTDEALLKRCGSADLTEDAQAVIGEEIRRRGLSVARTSAPADPVEPRSLSGDLVNVARYLTLPEAHSLQILLEAEAIPAFLADGYMAQSIFAPVGANSGARLMVHEKNLGRAAEVLAALRNGDYELGDAEP